MTDQSMDITKVQLGEQVSFNGVIYRNRKVSKTAASPRHTAVCMTAHKAVNWSFEQLNSLESVLSKGLWSKSLPGSWAGLSLPGS